MDEKKCTYCGSTQYKSKLIDYLYSKGEQYLLVKDFPVEICSSCGMVYYNGRSLEEVEKTFTAIYQQRHKPDDEVLMPVTIFV